MEILSEKSHFTTLRAKRAIGIEIEFLKVDLRAKRERLKLNYTKIFWINLARYARIK